MQKEKRLFEENRKCGYLTIAKLSIPITLAIWGQAIIKPLINHQGIICGVAFDRSSLRRIAPYASVVSPRRLASNTLLVIRILHKPEV